MSRGAGALSSVLAGGYKSMQWRMAMSRAVGALSSKLALDVK